MYRSPFVLGLSAVFAGLTAVLTIGAVVSGQPFALIAAVPLGITSYFMYYHGAGKLARAVRHRAESGSASRRRGGFGAGPRTRGGPRTRTGRRARSADGVRQERHSRSQARRTASGPTLAEARRTLDVGTRADESEIKRAYREKVKEVHPDRGGDEAEFKRVTAAYDRLTK